MNIKYAGPKVIISRRGLDFDNNKEDKYVYLNIAVQLLEAFDHDHTPGQVYTYDTSSQRLSDGELLAYVTKNFDESATFLANVQKDAQWYVDHEHEQVERQRPLMSEEECRAWLKNIELMKNYVIQRHFNKRIYYALINKLGIVLKEKHITQINAPMYQKFAHVLHSVQGVLKQNKPSIDSKIAIFEKEGTLTIQLTINH